MKKLLLLSLILMAFSGCEKKFNNPVETNMAVYQVAEVSSFHSFSHTLTDSIINPSITFTSVLDIRRVWIEILTPGDEKISPGAISLYDNGSPAAGDLVKGDNSYSALIIMKNEYVNGTYLISYFVEDKTSAVKKVASQTFLFDNGKSNIAPLILSVSAPDTIEVKEVPLAFIVSATVADSNGLKDIKEVYFTTVKPNQPSSGSRTMLYDDGNYTTNGDGTAEDGVFSRALSITPENEKGTYRFDFEAKDRGGLGSQVVRIYIVVK
ncbi:MAG: hypothetical protein COW85_01950 [Ignavibacteria bacterium CG22_combo_CG10-13_8_21_14_all_37_15]|nr:hypothetical protein [Ignavibacteria bacterium]PIP79176.1 MAG: hypothetical protein COW85_01950 [Ignavibacteria bacterium CG22_combo_CG10-13_8_21_14_all_37_15]PIS43706.1 MAG: hypothetical protein COT22_14435 [Ignavibacteria bacterium CG08_land_8_20_14_0_20_37_9]PIX93725.1 MAG: hypothetical protein COZ25_09160 [Ignavibacteria bacterium CG_4_10_14_3_um_filter_37_18]PJC59899.1 MAG: hypothetical protein CO025_04865 [Ignavibacteria bacterium CG_4_9_14_0_2_um_filter_37_13]